MVGKKLIMHDRLRVTHNTGKHNGRRSRVIQEYTAHLVNVKSVHPNKVLTYRGRWLATACLNTENLRGQVTLSGTEAQPVDVGGRSSGSGDVARLCTDDKGVTMAFLARRREVPLGREAAARRARYEIVLAQDEGLPEHIQLGNHILGRGFGWRFLPCREDQVGNSAECRLGQAREVEELGIRADGAEQR